MPFEIPTLPALITRANDDLAGAGVNGMLSRSDSAVMARVSSGGAFGLYGLLGWLAKQILPDSCDEDVLVRWAELKDVPRASARSATGFVDVTGGDVTVAAGFVWQTGTSIRVVATQDTALANGVASVPVSAELPGAAGNLPAGTRLTAVSPLDGGSDQASVSVDGIRGGTDIEPLGRWRARVVRRFQRQPNGGDSDDYEMWALEVSGITRAWCRRNWVGPGTVGVFVVRDDDENIVPDAGELATVAAHIESKRPVTPEIYVMAPTLLAVPFQIKLEPDTEALRAKVAAALSDLFLNEADLGTRLYRTHVSATISNVPVEVDHTLTEPAADIVPDANELPVLGDITWL